jgi:hypothetical protein
MADLRSLATDLGIAALKLTRTWKDDEKEVLAVDTSHILMVALELSYYRQLLAQPGAQATPRDVQYGVSLRINLETLLDAFAAKVIGHPDVQRHFEAALEKAGLGAVATPPATEP